MSTQVADEVATGLQREQQSVSTQNKINIKLILDMKCVRKITRVTARSRNIFFRFHKRTSISIQVTTCPGQQARMLASRSQFHTNGWPWRSWPRTRKRSQGRLKAIYEQFFVAMTRDRSWCTWLSFGPLLRNLLLLKISQKHKDIMAGQIKANKCQLQIADTR